MNKSDLIARVLCCHPIPGDESVEVKQAKLRIKKRYREIRRQMPFTQAELISKVEWLDDVLGEE